MKKLIIAILLSCISLAGSAQNDRLVPAEKIMTLISSYSGHDGFEVIKMGSFGTSIIKSSLKLAASKDDEEDLKKVMKLMKGIKKMAIVDYDDADQRSRDAFNSKLERLLASSELLMEANDGDGGMKIYGLTDNDGTEIRNFVMHAPKDGALICLFGSIKVDDMMEIAAEEQDCN